MPKFTDKFIATLKDDGRYTSNSDTGFQIKVEKGRKYFVYRFKLDDKRHDLTLGSYPKISLKEVRQRYTDSRAAVIHGDTPEVYWKLWKNHLETIFPKNLNERILIKCK